MSDVRALGPAVPGADADADAALDALVALEQECFGDDAWSRAALADAVAGTGGTTLLVTGEPVVGYAVLSVAGDIADLQRIAVAPRRRRLGLAGDLLAEVVARAGAARADRLLLEVRADNRGALAFYAAAGFVEIDRRERYYRDGATAVVMRRGLGRGCGGRAPA
ncbi:GNAT family N-acetyltransferase [Nocardioides sp.]|uniref:GNAT family N-acetyltransferase n=1 Tax=Nocardioides sp. TaxID=35761 RepID=UPI0035151B15